MFFVKVLLLVLAWVGETTSLRIAQGNGRKRYETKRWMVENVDLDEVLQHCHPRQEKLLFLDNDLIVISKVANEPTVPSTRSDESLAKRMSKIFGLERIDYMVAHRLDVATSGIVVLARNTLALSSLQSQFRQKAVKKMYKAVVSGRVNAAEGEINLPIGDDVNRGSPLQKVDPLNGKKSFTQWEVSSVHRDVTVINLYPTTGRTHQLRVHTAAIGNPIVGDYFYAPDNVYRSSDRLLLHAESIRFEHPRSKQIIEIHSPSNFDQLAVNISIK